ncbi:MAG TPA: hypothetical protein VMA97_12685 [Streptosporangiaceae bacterium]|nr:hypothetical protein [Streptosporangiaceae bacterium]
MELDTAAEGGGALLPGPRPHPEQVRPSDTAPTNSARDGWRRFWLLSRFRT